MSALCLGSEPKEKRLKTPETVRTLLSTPTTVHPPRALLDEQPRRWFICIQACAVNDALPDLCWSERWIVPTCDANHRVGHADRREENRRRCSSMCWRKKFSFPPKKTRWASNGQKRYAGTPTLFVWLQACFAGAFPGKRDALFFFSAPTVVLCQVVAWSIILDTDRRGENWCFSNVWGNFIFLGAKKTKWTSQSWTKIRSNPDDCLCGQGPLLRDISWQLRDALRLVLYYPRVVSGRLPTWYMRCRTGRQTSSGTTGTTTTDGSLLPKY